MEILYSVEFEDRGLIYVVFRWVSLERDSVVFVVLCDEELLEELQLQASLSE